MNDLGISKSFLGQALAESHLEGFVEYHRVKLTLPLSGRQGAWGGEAESGWRPVHSRGLLGAPKITFYNIPSSS